MADLIMPPQLGPGGEPVTSTTTQLTPSNRSEWSQKEMSPEARAQLRAWLDATDAQEQAQMSGPPADTRTAEDIAAEAASQEQSQIAMDRAQVAAMPDPFAPPSDAPPAIEGKMPLTFQGKPIAPIQEAQPQAGVDRPFTSQEFAATPEMRGPQTLEAAKDEAAIFETQAKARLAKEQADSLAAQQADRERRQNDAMARINAASDDYAKLSAKLFEEPSTLSRIMGAVAMGMGAFGASQTGGPNYAYEIIKTNQQRDLDAKKLRLQGALKRMEAAGQSFEEIDKWAKLQQERLMAISKAQIGAIDTSVSRMLAPFPRSQQEWAQKSAELKAENAAKIANFVQSATGETRGGGSSMEGVRQTVTEKAGAGPQIQQFDKTLSLHGNIMKRAMDDMAKRPQPSKAAMDKAQDNETFLLTAVQEAKTTGGAVKQYLLRKLDIMPRTSTEGLSESDQIYLNDMMRINTSFLRITSGAAIKDDEFIRMADELLLKGSDTPALRAHKISQMNAIKDDLLSLSGPGPANLLRQPDGQRAPAEAKASEPRKPPAKAEAQKKLLALPADDRAWATKALMMKRDDPAFEKADKWLRARGLR